MSRWLKKTGPAIAAVLLIGAGFSGCATTSRSSSVGQTVGQAIAFGIDSVIDLTAGGIRATSNGVKTLVNAGRKNKNYAAQ